LFVEGPTVIGCERKVTNPSAAVLEAASAVSAAAGRNASRKLLVDAVLYFFNADALVTNLKRNWAVARALARLTPQSAVLGALAGS